MAIATRIPRYNKSQKLYIDETETTLIEHLKKLRTENKITKKRISNIIKQNDTWYSQIERSGKNGDDNRQKTIYRPDLINIISIVKYGASSISDLGKHHSQSEIYIDKIIKATPLNESLRTLEWYEINNRRTPDEQERLFESVLSSIKSNNSFKVSAFSGALLIRLLISVLTKAVVAICVVFVPAVAVGAFGVPVNVGLSMFAFFDSKVLSTFFALVISVFKLVAIVFSAFFARLISLFNFESKAFSAFVARVTSLEIF